LRGPNFKGDRGDGKQPKNTYVQLFEKIRRESKTVKKNHLVIVNGWGRKEKKLLFWPATKHKTCRVTFPSTGKYQSRRTFTKTRRKDPHVSGINTVLLENMKSRSVERGTLCSGPPTQNQKK